MLINSRHDDWNNLAMIYFCSRYFSKINDDSLKRHFLHIVIILMAFQCAYQPLYAQKGTKIKTVVIDAGHGGQDPGSVCKYSK